MSFTATLAPRPIGSPDDIIIYDGVPHSRAYALAEFAAARVPAGFVERAMAEARVIFSQSATGTPVFFERAKPCHDDRGRFAPCDGAGGEEGEKARADKKEKKEKAEKTERKAKDKEEKLRNKDTQEKLKTAAKEVRAIAREKTFPPPSGVPVLKGPPTPERSRVGVPGNQVPPPPANIPRLPNLTADERYAEDRFATAFERSPDKMADDFLKATLADQASAEARGKAKDPNFAVCPTFETDAAKMMSGDYNPQGVSKQEGLDAKGRYNAAVHQTANAITKRAFVKYLDEVAKMPAEKRRVLVTSGGCGAGKGYAVENAMGPVMSQVGACWDAAGEQNATENPWIMDECEKRGIRPTFVFVHADPSSSWEDPAGGVISRAKGKGRMVDARLFTDSYVEGAKNFKEFMGKHEKTGKADFICIDNSVRGKNPDGSPILPKKLDAFPDKALALDSEKLYARSANYVAAVADLTPAIRRGASIGRRIWGQPKSA